MTRLCFALALGLLFGCKATLIGRARDENPLRKPDRVSEGIAIATKDAQIIANAGQAVDPAGQPGYASTGAQYYHPTFFQSAIFQVRSGDQLIFLIELTSRWPELAHGESYDITLSDDTGRTWKPEVVSGQAAHVVGRTMTLGRADVIHMVVTTGSGTHIYRHGEDASSADMKSMLGARTTLEFRGEAILRPDTRRLTLSLRHPNRSLQFVWDFE